MTRFLTFTSLACFIALSAGFAPADDVAVAIQGTPKVDGDAEAIWLDAPKIDVNQPIVDLLQIDEDEMATATVQFMWDKKYLYALWRVKDDELSADASEVWAQDSVELFLDQNKQASSSYQSDDAQYRVNFEGDLSGQGAGFDESDLKAAVSKTEDGYLVEMSVRVKHADLKAGAKLGMELQVNDDHDSGGRDAVAKWHHTEDDSWEDTSNFGTLELK